MQTANDTEPDDISEQPTIYLEVPEKHYIGPYCPLCLLRLNSSIYPAAFDARYYALAICDKHLHEWENAPEEMLDDYAQYQFYAVERWAHPPMMHRGE